MKNQSVQDVIISAIQEAAQTITQIDPDILKRT